MEENNIMEETNYFKEGYIKSVIPGCLKRGLLCDFDKDFFSEDLTNVGYKMPENAEGDYYLIKDEQLGYIILYSGDSNVQWIIDQAVSDLLYYLSINYGRDALGEFLTVRTQKSDVKYIYSHTYEDVSVYILPLEDYEATIKYIADRRNLQILGR